MQLTDFRILTFDTLGTVIDWETGILRGLEPLQHKLATPISDDVTLELFARFESAQQAATPTMLYSELLTTVYQQLATEWELVVNAEEAAQFGATVGTWPAFVDAVDALAELKQHYKLVTVTNCDNRSYQGLDASLGQPWDAIWTAEDIGSYKPAAANFEYLLAHVQSEFGFAPAKILHVAQSMYHDHVPAKAIGLTTAWIDRRHDLAGFGATKVPAEIPTPDFHYRNMAEFVQACRQAFAT